MIWVEGSLKELEEDASGCDPGNVGLISWDAVISEFIVSNCYMFFLKLYLMCCYLSWPEQDRFLFCFFIISMKLFWSNTFSIKIKKHFGTVTYRLHFSCLFSHYLQL